MPKTKAMTQSCSKKPCFGSTVSEIVRGQAFGTMLVFGVLASSTSPLRWSRVVTNPPLPESGGSSSPPPPPGSKPTLFLQHGEVGDKSVKIAAGLKILKENWFGSSGIG